MTTAPDAYRQFDGGEIAVTIDVSTADESDFLPFRDRLVQTAQTILNVDVAKRLSELTGKAMHSNKPLAFSSSFEAGQDGTKVHFVITCTVMRKVAEGTLMPLVMELLELDLSHAATAALQEYHSHDDFRFDLDEPEPTVIQRLIT